MQSIKTLNPLHWFRNRSIFFKLILVMILAALLVNMLVGSVIHRVTRPPVANFHKFVSSCARYALSDLEQSPLLETGQGLSQRFGIKLRYEGQRGSWSTSPNIPPIQELEANIQQRPRHFGPPLGMGNHAHLDRPNRVRYGKYQDHFFMVVPMNGDRVVLWPDFSYRGSFERLILFTLGTLTFIFLLTYLLLRRLLRPIQNLKVAVERVGEGEFDQELEVKGRDELGRLTEAFNRMTSKVKELVGSKERLLLDVSHELRSPLTRMKFALEFLPDSKSKANLAEDVEIMQKMITELLESARLQSNHGELHLENVDLRETLEETVAKLSHLNPGVELNLPENQLQLPLDRERMGIALKNLIENGLKYSKEGGRPVLVHLQSINEQAIRIVIQDFGVGIPAEELPFIFDPFYRTDKSRSKKTGGYGLGLSLSKKIIQAHGGTIEVESELGQGTTLHITLPRLA